MNRKEISLQKDDTVEDDAFPVAYAEPDVDLTKPMIGMSLEPDIDMSIEPMQQRQQRMQQQNQTDVFAVRKESRHFDEDLVERLVNDNGMTKGLVKALDNMNNDFAKRIWIIDNSGSMYKNDGNQIIEGKVGKKVITKMQHCTRWEEMRTCINYHIKLAGMMQAPTSFVFLNDPGKRVGPQRFEISMPPSNSKKIGVANNKNNHGGDGGVQAALDIMKKAEPSGFTPLAEHIAGVTAEIALMAPHLKEAGKRVAVIIATDGLPTDREGQGGEHIQRQFTDSILHLQKLPVWVVIRLCTQEEDVVEFYNELDANLELSIEVLDDFVGEAYEMGEHNPWLNYGLSMHRLREIGYHDRVLDLLDERRLTTSEMQKLCEILFSEDHFERAPDPATDWHGFVKFVDHCREKEIPHWNPLNHKKKSFISLKQLEVIYGNETCSIM